MDVVAPSLAPFREIRPGNLAAYLRGTGWREAASSGVFGPIWRLRDHQDQDYEILFPENPTFLDYPLRAQEAVHNLAIAEGRSVEQILAAIQTATLDVMRIHLAASATSGELPLEAGARLFGAIERVVRFAAWAAIEPRPVFKGRAPALLAQYLRECVWFGQTERGSYVVTVHAVPPPRPGTRVQASSSYLALLDQPLAQTATRTLAASLAALARLLRSAPDHIAAQLQDAVGSGLSANLCDALTAIIRQNGPDDLHIDFSWSALAPVPDVPLTITLPRTVVPRLAAIAKSLRSAPVQYSLSSARTMALKETPDLLGVSQDDGQHVGLVTQPIEGDATPLQVMQPQVQDVRGLVTALDGDGPLGRTVITAYLDGRPYSVALDLKEIEYDVAREAYDQRLPVRSTGILIQEGRGFLLREPRDFRFDARD